MGRSDRDELIKLIQDTSINWATTPELLADTILESKWLNKRLNKAYDDGFDAGVTEAINA